MEGSEENICWPIDIFVQKLPKLEVHAHLNGSISLSSLNKLLHKKNSENLEPVKESITFSKRDTLSLTEIEQTVSSFKDRALPHQKTILPCQLESLATCDVIQEFAQDNVHYLELRSTPREVAGQMSRRSYVETVLAAINKSQELGLDIIVKFLLSIDRRNPLAVAEETVHLAKEFMLSSDAMVGIDLSGDPCAGDACSFIPVLSCAKNAGLKLALHLGEVPDKNAECRELLKLFPDRIGHGTFLHSSKGATNDVFSIVCVNQVPLEICLTSNVTSKTVSSYSDHHFNLWYSAGHPCILCTDDKGVFQTSLSNEYLKAAEHYHLNQEQLWNLSYSSIDHCFADSEVKSVLKEKWKQLKNELLPACPEMVN
ncbi:adenosine deaminase-like protein [Limulus polyphemus]|uniref:Adenosine deaminase-like protein n=1 Tax=Limulus polyphemus TaxID=6850 RepID=A0ABM1BYM9_LIMPO|nr:adenosine deaminase-like protein [Limulus polyphemus]